MNFSDPFGLCPEGQIELDGECVTYLTGTPPLVSGSGIVSGVARAAGAARAAYRTARLIRDARTILRSAEFAQLRAAAAAGENAAVEIAGRTITFEAGGLGGASGMAWLGRGFHLAPQAFASEVELTKTVLQELFRLGARAASAEVSGAVAASETSAAAAFADKAYQIGRVLGVW